MAKEPKDRDEARRSDAPAENGDATPSHGGDATPARAGSRKARRDEQGATNDDPNFLPDDSFLLDVGEEAPRVQSAAEDDASEEWILVDDDLLAAAAEADAAGLPKSGAKSPAADPKRDDEAARLIEEMKEIAAELAPVTPFDEDGSAAERERAATQEEPGAVAAVDAEGAKRDVAEIPPAVSEAGAPSLAPVLDLAPSEAQPEASRPMRRQMSRAAGIAIAASLVAGSWIAVQIFGSHTLPSTVVATKPNDGDKPVQPPPPKPGAKPLPKKPEIENATPPAPPDVAVKKPTPDPKPAPDPTAATKPAPVDTIPVIPVNPLPDPGLTAGATNLKPSSSDPAAKPANPKAAPNIVDTRIPIRPAKPLGTASAKSSSTGRKTDTIVELKNGYTLRGKIKRVKDDQITLGVQGGEFTFALADVKVLDSNAPEYLSEADMPPVSIVLKSGQRMRGKLLKANADHVVLVVEQGEMVIDRTEIREVSFTGRIHF